MSAQRVATGIGLAGLAALAVSVGVPTLVPPEPVDEIQVGGATSEETPRGLVGESGDMDDPFDDPSDEDDGTPRGDTAGSGDASLDSADDPADSPDDAEGGSDD